MELFSEVMEQLRQKGIANVPVVAGGIIPEEDIPALQKIGIKVVFGPGTSTSEIVESIQGLVVKR
jgi:methylmalonyl-CoA mutase C-terminal domain/subunit